MARPDTPRMPVANRDSSDAGVLQHVVQALDLTGAVVDQRGAEPGQVPQSADWRRWHEARSDQSVFDELGDPYCVRDVALAARHDLDVLGVHQPASKDSSSR